MGRGTQWTLLGLANDPVPGDPSKLDYLISRMHSLADDADRARRGVVGLLADRSLNGWLGASGDAFRDACEPLPDHLQKLRQSYEDAASALTTYQAALTDARSRSDAACSSAVNAYDAYNCRVSAPPAGGMDDGSYASWVNKIGHELKGWEAQQKGQPFSGTPQHPFFDGPIPQSPEQSALLAARQAALQAQTDNNNAANKCHQALEDAAHIAAGLSKITGAGASTPGLTFDERFKNAGGDVSKLVLDPAAGQDVETAGMPPTGTSPQDVTAWWNSLDDAARERYIHDHAGEIAGLDGIPQEARDKAYRVLHPVHDPDDGDHTGSRSRHARHHTGDHPTHHDPHGPHKPHEPSGGRHRGGAGPHGPVMHERDPRDRLGDDPHQPVMHERDPSPPQNPDPWRRPVDSEPGHVINHPGGPHDPTDPRDPGQHRDPIDPGHREHVDPHDPKQPTDSYPRPVDPDRQQVTAHPVHGGQPADPNNPADPGQSHHATHPGHWQPGDPSDPSDPGQRHGDQPGPGPHFPHDPASPSVQPGDPGPRTTMQPPGVDPQQPVEHHHQTPAWHQQPSQPTDYQVASAPQHSDAPQSDLWRSGSHDAYQNISAPESAPWLPGANVPHDDAAQNANAWMPGPHAPRVDASMDSSAWRPGPDAPRVDANMVSDSWAPGPHAPRVEAGMDSGMPTGVTGATAATSDPWLPGAQMPLAEPHVGQFGDGFHHADGFANGGFANAAVQQANRLVAEAFQPVDSGPGDFVHASGAFPGAFPGDAVSGSVSAVASNGVLAGNEQVAARHYEDLSPEHVVGRRYYV